MIKKAKQIKFNLNHWLLEKRADRLTRMANDAVMEYKRKKGIK